MGKEFKRAWNCKCDCGNVVDHPITTGALLSGRTRPCGCLVSDKVLDLNKTKRKHNTYEYFGLYAKGTCENGYFLCDAEDVDKLKEHYWYQGTRGYVMSDQYINGSRKRIKMHRYLTDVAHDDMEHVVDHINGVTNDNRKLNLRVCTAFENAHNTKIPIINKTGVKGVHFSSRNKNKYEATIGFKGKNIHLGTFDNLEDASIARKRAEEKYQGEFAYNPDAPRIEVS